MALHVRVCRVSDIPTGEMRGFTVEGVDKPILIANIDGVFRATASMCPHEDVSLLDGDLDGSKLTCPGHSYEFDVVTGACTHDPELCLNRYQVTIVGEELYVDLV